MFASITEFKPRNQEIKQYTDEDLGAAFDSVKNSKNWKNPINRLISNDADRELIARAIIYFTGSRPEFIEQNGKTRVIASGYYNAIGM